MKFVFYFIIFITLYSCTCSNKTKLVYDQNSSDISKLIMIDNILKNPDYIIDMCNDNKQVNDYFKSNFCNLNSDLMNLTIKYISEEFIGENRILSSFKDSNKQAFEVQNVVSSSKIFFIFQISDNNFKLSNIHGNIVY